MEFRRKRILFSLAIAGFLLTTCAVGPISAADPPNISTTTGLVTSIDEDRCAIVIFGSMLFYPAQEVAKKQRGERGPIPDWVQVGSEVSLSYFVEGGNRFYLDVVRPRHGFPVKEALEEGRETPQ